MQRRCLTLLVAILALVIGGCESDATEPDDRSVRWDVCLGDRQVELQRCLERRAREEVERDGVDDALERADDAAVEDSDLGNACHVAWHALGEEDGHAGEDEELRVRSIGGPCSEGYVHGMLIGRWQRLDLDALRRTAVADCELGAAGSSMQCIHSFGHAAWKRQGTRAHETCDALDEPRSPDSAFVVEAAGREPAAVRAQVRLECSKGAAMEAAFPGDDRDAEPWTACAKLAGAARLRCSAFAPLQSSMLGGSDADAAKVCSTTGWTRAQRVACGFGVGGGTGEAAACTHVTAGPARAACEAAVAAIERDGFAAGTGDATLLERLAR